MFEQVSTVDLVTYTENGVIQVRRADIVKKDGVEIARAYNRHTVAPGADLSSEDAKVQAISNALWTPEIIAAYEAEQAALLAAMEQPAQPAQEQAEEQPGA